MFRKKRNPARSPEAVKDQMQRMRPALDARLASGEETDPARLTQMLLARALTRVVEEDLAGALEDADSATALGVLTTEQERSAAIVESQAVSRLGIAPRWEAALARLEALPTDGVGGERLEFARLERMRLLSLLGRHREVRALVRTAPWDVQPGPQHAERLLARALIRLSAGEAEAALHDVDAALAARLAAEHARTAANTGAYCIAVLALTDRLAEALAWADLACSVGLDGAEPGVAELDTRAAVRAMAGRGAEVITALEAGLAHIERADPTSPGIGWSHAFLARAHLDAGHHEQARHHADQAVTVGARTPVLGEVRRRLAAGPAAPP